MLWGGEVIRFNSVEVNEGNGYSGETGEFTCPDNAVYMFTWSFQPSLGSLDRGKASLFMDNEEIKQGPQTDVVWYTVWFLIVGVRQMTAVVECKPLSVVKVVSQIFPSTWYDELYSTFSGYRLSSTGNSTGFTVELSDDIQLFPNERIIFNNVVTNIGGYYNAETGSFQCPDNGTYSFSLSTQTPVGDYVWSSLKMVFDGEIIIDGPITHVSTPTVESGSASFTVLLECQAGKNIYVETKKTHDFDYNLYGGGLTSFTGARLCESCDKIVAFSSVLTRNVTQSSVDVALGKVLLNYGNAYDPVTGIFTCPDDLLYFLTWSGTSFLGDCRLDLFLNAIAIKYNYLTPTSSDESFGTSGTSTRSTIVRCSPGSKLSLRGAAISSTRILLADYTSFSGYQIPGQ